MLLGQRGEASAEAREHAERLFDVRAIGIYDRHESSLGQVVAEALRSEVDYLFSFLSPVIVPKLMLDAVRKAAINFHPAPPEHPGVGSASYALFQGDAEFGATAHLMTPQVDAGPILRVTRFAIDPDATCETLFQGGISAALALFRELLTEIRLAGPPKPIDASWARPPVSRREFERWMTLSPSASDDEVERKVRAVRHSALPGPYLQLAGHRFALLPAAARERQAAVHRKRIPWWEPEMTGLELAEIERVIDANYLNEGDVTARFEVELAKLLGVAHVVTATSGTSAIFMALAALGVGPGDEVIVPDLTFIATANAVTLTGARPVLADIDANTLNLSADAFERAITRRTKVVIPVHVSGRGANMSLIDEIARAHRVQIVEDAAEAFMSRHDGSALGSFGIAGCFSFSPNKTITTGQGGAIATNDAAFAQRLRELKDQGRPVRGTGGDDLHPTIGFNFKFTNLQAAVGLAQLTKLPKRLLRQIEIFRTYEAVLKDLPGIRLLGFDIPRGEVPQWTDALVERRAAFDAFLAERGVGCRRFWLPLHDQAPYRDRDEKFPIAARVAKQAIWLPSAFTMTDVELSRAADLMRTFVRGAHRAPAKAMQ